MQHFVQVDDELHLLWQLLLATSWAQSWSFCSFFPFNLTQSTALSPCTLLLQQLLLQTHNYPQQFSLQPTSAASPPSKFKPHNPQHLSMQTQQFSTELLLVWTTCSNPYEISLSPVSHFYRTTSGIHMSRRIKCIEIKCHHHHHHHHVSSLFPVTTLNSLSNPLVCYAPGNSLSLSLSLVSLLPILPFLTPNLKSLHGVLAKENVLFGGSMKVGLSSCAGTMQAQSSVLWISAKAGMFCLQFFAPEEVQEPWLYAQETQSLFFCQKVYDSFCMWLKAYNYFIHAFGLAYISLAFCNKHFSTQYFNSWISVLLQGRVLHERDQTIALIAIQVPCFQTACNCISLWSGCWNNPPCHDCDFQQPEGALCFSFLPKNLSLLKWGSKYLVHYHHLYRMH